MTADQQTFADHRNLLFAIAYRILGSAADAEDVVQDAWFKWSADDRSQVSDPKAYLARIVSNLSMERLRSTRRQRETYVGPWLPEPILTQADAADDVAAAESVSMAMLVVLETLSPLERAVFVLKEAQGPRTRARPATTLRGRSRQEARGHRAILRRCHRRRYQ
jgi:RNA polymerase sigma factor (sigma-70 family)